MFANFLFAINYALVVLFLLDKSTRNLLGDDL